jgi:hypothetical protein
MGQTKVTSYEREQDFGQKKWNYEPWEGACWNLYNSSTKARTQVAPKSLSIHAPLQLEITYIYI